jgi:DEAD/DEAH box helicase domain-containing protein
MPVPYINVANRVLAQRHVNSLLLGYFLRSLTKADFEDGVLDSITVDLFFLQPPAGPTLCDRFATWANSPTENARFKKILTEVLADNLKPAAAEMLESVRSLTDSGLTSVINFDVKAPLDKYQEQLTALSTQLGAAVGNQRRAIANAMSLLERLTGQFKTQRLIDFLSSASWLPGYAFPQDIVKLLVRHVELTDRMRLEREREVGIAEYAPGAKIVADGHLLRSGAIWFNSREPEVRWYSRCPNCRKISTCLESQQLPPACDRCGTVITGHNTPKRYLKPDAFSTNASDLTEEPGTYRRRPPRNSEVFLLEGANPDAFKEHTIPGVTFGVKPSGRMFRANSGYDFAGFRVCRKCGRSFESLPAGGGHEPP